MRYEVKLINAHNCELDARAIDLPQGEQTDEGTALSRAVMILVADWSLSDGDTITIKKL